MQVRRGRSSGV